MSSPPAPRMSLHVTLRQLRAFQSVARLGSFTDASHAMHLSQAALSGLIKALETQLGIQLLERTTRRVVPSMVGQAFLPQIELVLDELDQALSGITQLKELRRGLVRIAAPETLSCTLLPELITAFRAAHPGIELRFRDVAIESVVEGLHDRSLDVGFGPTAASEAEPLLLAHELWRDPLWVALRTSDPLAACASVKWKDLREHRIFSYMRTFRSSVLNQVPARQRPEKIESVQRVNTALSMVRVDGGAVIAPSLVFPLVSSFGLAFKPLVRPVVARGIALYVRRQGAMSPAVESFLDFSRRFARQWAADGVPARPGTGP
ncbi:MAG: LysR family transcriptional regulator [Burkholderiaceae bacterium]